MPGLAHVLELTLVERVVAEEAQGAFPDAPELLTLRVGGADRVVGEENAEDAAAAPVLVLALLRLISKVVVVAGRAEPLTSLLVGGEGVVVVVETPVIPVIPVIPVTRVAKALINAFQFLEATL